ncbi:Transcriptional regulatory protein FixJ [Posidoniimonas polymericola]|uniref:Transcriptional regulatory protein FixJ n=1 Tax=Posidoniimonas polymericola TaxID=2528002 RepID=A0A5C5YRW8_9BACT|nr:response regulator [Posidoniimonas polymericola]TWT77682.1 Transcriptional regulatory protein FixJ [Posidoniimonas polymericola]
MIATDNGPLSAEQKRVFVIEDDAAARSAVCEMLEPKGLKVEAYGSAEEFLANRKPEGPSCLLLDDRLPGMRGSELLRRLAEDGVQTPAVLITGYATTSTTVDAMRHGAVSVLDKPCSDIALEEAVGAAIAADVLRREQEQPSRVAKERLSKLNDSEMEVLRMVLDGVPNKQIASRMGVCIRTVESRRSKIYSAAQVNSVAELVRLCVAAGVVD